MGAATVVALVSACGSGADSKRVHDAVDRAGSWAATVKAVTEQWAQARVSLRFTRTTIDTASSELTRDATSIRSLDPSAAARLDRLRRSIDPVMDAVVRNEPDRARDLARSLTP